MGLLRTITGNDRSNKHGCNEVSETHCETFISFFLRRTLITLNVDILQHHWLDISMGKHLTNNTTAAMAEMREAFYFFNEVQYEWGVIIR